MYIIILLPSWIAGLWKDSEDGSHVALHGWDWGWDLFPRSMTYHPAIQNLCHTCNVEKQGSALLSLKAYAALPTQTCMLHNEPVTAGLPPTNLFLFNRNTARTEPEHKVRQAPPGHQLS
jgi:hypothetical protein